MAYQKIIRERLEEFLLVDQVAFESNRAAEISALLAGTSKKGGDLGHDFFMEYGTSLNQLNKIRRNYIKIFSCRINTSIFV